MKVATVSASLLLITFLLTFSSGNGQTFQYSRGWTNGKRSNPFLAYAKHTETPWNLSDDIATSYRQWELSHLLARLPLSPYGFHVYAYDLTPSTTTTPASIASHFYQRPQIKHETESIATNQLPPLPANSNEISDRYKRKTNVLDITG